MSKIICVVPTNRPAQMEAFRKAWKPLFEKHSVTLIIVWDGGEPKIQIDDAKPYPFTNVHSLIVNRDLFCRYTDGVRNMGFVVACEYFLDSPDDVLLTLDDDVAPRTYDLSKYGGAILEIVSDPIQAHLDALNRKIPLSWMNTAHDTDLCLRGVPYGIRDEAPVMLSHGVWVGTPDFDGQSQLELEAGAGVPYTLPYYVGPIPRGVMFPLCGMSVMVRREALPYFFFAPMGPDSGVEGLHRFGDIWLGVNLKLAFDELGWGCYTGASTVLHTRKSDATKNYEQEKLGREWNESVWHFEQHGYDPKMTPACYAYLTAYAEKRRRYAELIHSILGKPETP